MTDHNISSPLRGSSISTGGENQILNVFMEVIQDYREIFHQLFYSYCAHFEEQNFVITSAKFMQLLKDANIMSVSFFIKRENGKILYFRM